MEHLHKSVPESDRSRPLKPKSSFIALLMQLKLLKRNLDREEEDEDEDFNSGYSLILFPMCGLRSGFGFTGNGSLIFYFGFFLVSFYHSFWGLEIFTILRLVCLCCCYRFDGGD
ncbi:hypothetical protein CsatA_026852 [Cannabis sativa]